MTGQKIMQTIANKSEWNILEENGSTEKSVED